ncbi:PASTA domain-containing protein [Nocardioides sp. ChNu-153]|uniref:PASTA domain-containing protein n=1 Tax=unclassified Nocardioides TaxID=2615069 RepID=UPI002406B07F|nr:MULTISPECIES: PASTA domain-containing protein [unclassified Nocardioides]MDF9715426.1 PASTA domain-containing protein [Nocardioides sp. ChNu-99]MDN7120589.1 PASTA domain-containing protein [Nocardioides sp. ChNu-153]
MTEKPSGTTPPDGPDPDVTLVVTLLHGAVADLDAGTPPLAALHARAGRERRRTRVWAAGAAAGLVAAAASVVVGGVTVLGASLEADRQAPAPLAASAADAELAVPPGSQLVAVGNQAVVVPRDVGVEAGQATVQEAESAADFHLAGTPGLLSGDAVPYSSDYLLPATPRGGIAPRGGYAPYDAPLPGSADALGVFAPLNTSTSLVEARTLRSHAGIPPLHPWGPLSTSAVAGEAPYVAALRTYGLDVELAEEVGRGEPGDVLAVSPAPGTIVDLGSTVTVTVVGRAR